MSNGNSQASSAPAGGSPPPSALPDINAETYPFDTVLHMLDEAAYQNMYSISTAQPILGREGLGVIGLRVKERLYRFSIVMDAPARDRVINHNTIGELVARFEHRWMFAPDGFPALPSREPPETVFDPSRSQRFVMLDSVCTFENDRDGFRGFGTGRTYTSQGDNQSPILAGAVGSILEGFGKFKGHEGTYTYCGTLSPQDGFRGNVLCRFVDPQGHLRSDSSLPSLEAGPAPEPGITYFMFRGQKKDRNQKTEYNFGPDGQVVGLNVHQQLRQVVIDSATRGRGGPRSSIALGPTIGNMAANIGFNLLNPGAPGTALSPIPFKSYNHYAFTDQRGREVGVIEADGGEGRTFNLTLAGAPGQQALRFGGVGPIVKGSGFFEDIQGLMADNSVVGVAPHALSTLYILRVNDPEGKYRH